MTVFAMVLPPGLAMANPSEGRLCSHADTLLAALPEAPIVVVLTPGREPTVEDVSDLVLPGSTVPVHGEPSLVAAITRRGQVPRVPSGELRGSSAMLAGAVQAVRPAARFVAVGVAVGADSAARVGAATALDGALAEFGGTIVVASGRIPAGTCPDASESGADLAGWLGRSGAGGDLHAARHHEVPAELTVLGHLSDLLAVRHRHLEIRAHAWCDGACHVVACAP